MISNLKLNVLTISCTLCLFLPFSQTYLASTVYKLYGIPLFLQYQFCIFFKHKYYCQWELRSLDRVLSCPPEFHSHCDLPHLKDSIKKGRGWVQALSEFRWNRCPSDMYRSQRKNRLCRAAPNLRVCLSKQLPKNGRRRRIR